MAMVDMHTAELGTAVERWKHFAGIEQTVRIKGAFDALLLVEIFFGKHRAHKIAFFDANAMLTG